METDQNSPARPLLEVKDLRTHFVTRRNVVRAVNGVSFQLMRGATLGLVGESGSGKTVTCLSILRLLPRGGEIAGGDILFEGRSIVDMSEKEMDGLRGNRIGMILQNSMAALDPVFTIGTQVAEPLVVHEGLTWRQALRRSVELLRMMKITAPHLRIRSFPHELSGGMRQRASSAASLGPQPSLLIADEPTTALDVTTQRQYLELLKELQQATGMAIIFITHDISIVGDFCDELAVFYGGIVVETGPKDQILDNPSHPYTEALLQAVPSLGDTRDRLRTIPGDPPFAADIPPGCPFHPRCDYAMEICQTGAPPPVFVSGDSRRVRCWLLEKDDGQRSDTGTASG